MMLIRDFMRVAPIESDRVATAGRQFYIGKPVAVMLAASKALQVADAGLVSENLFFVSAGDGFRQSLFVYRRRSIANHYLENEP